MDSFANKAMKKVIIAAGIALAIIASIILASNINKYIPDKDSTASEGASSSEPEPDRINVSGISYLVAFELPSEYMDPQYYYPVKKGEYDFIDRAIKNGITLITEDELRKYYEVFSESDKAYTFGVSTITGDIRYYVINYFETPLSLENHNIKITMPDIGHLPLEEFEQLPLDIKEYLKEAIADPYQWHTIDDDSAAPLVSLLRKDGILFRTTVDNYIGNGEEMVIKILYLGPYSEELQMPEFKDIYGDIGIVSKDGRDDDK